MDARSDPTMLSHTRLVVSQVQMHADKVPGVVEVAHQSGMTPLQVLSSAFGVSFVAGLAALLRSKKQLTVRAVIAAGLYNGMVGLIIGLLWSNYGRDEGDPYTVLGIAGVAGLMGLSALELAAIAYRKSGVSVTISGKPPKDEG